MVSALAQPLWLQDRAKAGWEVGLGEATVLDLHWVVENVSFLASRAGER